MEHNTDLFCRGLKELSIELSSDQIDQFMKYYDLLIEKNKVMNLTAITDYEEVMIKHFLDSLSIVKLIDLKNKDLRLLDIGTGAGFPGIPLKIAFPELNITLLDSLNKRINFLNEVIGTLSLESKGSIKAVHSRAEDYIKEEGIRESFDIVTSRAVANLSTLSEYCLPYVKIDGLFIPYKSEKSDEEMKAAENALNKLGGQEKDSITFILPQSDNISRTLIEIKKTCSTPDIYPRKAGLPSKKPL